MAERKTFLLRIDAAVLEGVQRWANDDLRSLNAQIEFVLRDSLRRVGRAPKPQVATDAPGSQEPPEAGSREPASREPKTGGAIDRDRWCRYKKACRCTRLPLPGPPAPF